MQKNLWICLILLKNRWLKYRFFALFRRVQQKVGAPGEKPVRSQRMERHAKRRGGGVPLTESDFCLRGPSPQNLHI